MLKLNLASEKRERGRENNNSGMFAKSDSIMVRAIYNVIKENVRKFNQYCNEKVI